jgi:hypothetical protein
MKPVEFRHMGPARLDGEIVKVVEWTRAYGIPYAKLEDGREVHQSALTTVD